MPAPAEIKKLVEKFARNRDEYKASSYNEHQVRIEFINPLLTALGWDVDNSEGASERYREVVHEDRVLVGGENKAPDYSCRLGGNRVFFVEAKKPSVDLKTNPLPAFQLRRYAWSAKLPVSVLTDFDELVIYDTTVKPGAKDKPTVGRLRYWTSAEFVEKWDEIAAILSKEAVKSGAFDKFAGERKRKATTQVDDDFLEAIEEWRDLLARDLARENPKLESEELSFAVQRILDRIVFLRICEDRGIDSPGQLHALTNGPGIYGRLKQLFERADKKYNSGLFHFREEKGRHESPDTLTPKLKVSDKALKTVIDALYDDAPWAFGVISADILGSIYEQFLGKVIHRDGRGVTIEEKPEVKKAGGVYYTPKYIVDYIVKETVGKLLEGKNPKEAAEIKILDPACGSGSFLIGAYQYLLDWHLEQYLESPGKYKKELVEFPKGSWRLTSQERKRILTNSIYGVDIDPQAVEVTKLSLLLKVLEGESAHSLQIAFELMPERALPDLGDNIRLGNSLVDEDVLARVPLELALEGNGALEPFNWKESFPSAMQRPVPGFDAVIGNPPYVLLQSLERQEAKAYLSARYLAARYKIDTYHVFMEKGVDLTRIGGNFGMITPSSYLRNKHAKALRAVLLAHTQPLRLDVFNYPVFAGASVDTAVAINQRTEKVAPGGQVVVSKWGSEAEREMSSISLESWIGHPTHDFGVQAGGGDGEWIRRMKDVSVPLGHFADAYFGIQTHDRERYVAAKQATRRHRPAIDGWNVNPFETTAPTEFVDTAPKAIKSGGRESVHSARRIGVRQIGVVPVAGIIPGGVHALNTLYNIFFTKTAPFTLDALLGLICSTPVRYFWLNEYFDEKQTFPKVKKAALLGIPVPTKGSGAVAKALWARLDEVVVARLKLARKTDPGKVQMLEQEVDHVVASMFGLSDAELREMASAVQKAL